MDFYFEQPLLGVICALASIAATAGILLTFRPRRWLSAAFVLLAALFASAGAAGLNVPSGKAARAMIFLIDESSSMAPHLPRIERRLATRISQLPAGIEPKVLGFAKNVRKVTIENGKVDLRQQGIGNPTPFAAIQQTLFEAGDNPTLVELYTDCAFSESDAPPIPDNVKLIVADLPRGPIADVGLVSLVLPTIVEPSAAVTATVGLYSNITTTAKLSVKRNGKQWQLPDVSLSPGKRELSVPLEFSLPGLHPVEFRITPTGLDSYSVNNVISRSVLVIGKGKTVVSYFSPKDRTEAEQWAKLAGPEVEVRSGVGDLSSVTGLIAVNAGAEDLPGRLLRYIRNGGAVLLTGGEESFGPNIAEHELAPALPALPREGSGETTDVLAVVDKSGSLDEPVAGTGENRFAYLKRGVILMMLLARDKTRFGCVVFDSRAQLILPLASYSTTALRNEAQRKVAKLVASGGTDLAKALSKTREVMVRSEAKNRHVVLFHDGHTAPGDFVAQARKLSQAGVELTVVAAGDYDRTVISSLVEASGGALIEFSDDKWQDVPALLKAILDEKRGEPVRRTESGVRITENGKRLLGYEEEPQLPTLSAMNILEMKDGGTALLVSETDGSPLGATRIYGNGRCSVFACALRANWAPRWTEKEPGEFLSRYVSATVGADGLPDANLYISHRNDEWYLTAYVLDEQGAPAMNRDVRVEWEEDGTMRSYSLKSFDAGRYRVKIDGLDSPVSARLIIDGRQEGVFPLQPAPLRDPVAYDLSPALFRAFANSIGATYAAADEDIRRSLPGYVNITWLLLLAFLLTALVHSALSLPQTRRVFAYVFGKSTG
ncbi:MAG: vWA domain-containing protein [Planctomycetota bacterium]|nr:vWA domain-containing protein [Planctomycetota bacterium]